MKSKAAMTNLEDLERWFQQCGSVEWNLYRGHQDKLNSLHLIASQKQSDVGMDESWDKLSQFIEMNTRQGGDITVYIPAGGNNRGFLAHFSVNTPGAMAGLGQPGAMSAMGAWGMGFIPIEEHERRAKELREKWDLERRLEDLEAENESRGGIWGNIAKEALSGIDVNQLIKMAYVGLMAKFNPGAINPQISINGMGMQTGAEDEQYDDQEEESPLANFVARTRPHFATDQEYLAFLDKVADFFEKNTQMAKSFFV